MHPTLLFVYNADSGLFNTVADIAHKILSPETYRCNLCALTHGHFKVRESWVKFLDTLDADCEFLHRDEFHAVYDYNDVALPAIFSKTTAGLIPLIDAETLRNCPSLNALQQLLSSRLSEIR